MTRQRRNFRKRDILDRFNQIGGKCEICGALLQPGKYHADHIIPDALDGLNEPNNMQLLYLPCHTGKTRIDVSSIAKAARREWQHKGPARAVSKGWQK